MNSRFSIGAHAFLLAALIAGACYAVLSAQGVRIDGRAAQIVSIMHAAHQDLAHGTDDQRRALTKMIIEQLIFEFPDARYGGKSSSPTNPFSKDSIARIVDGKLWGCDWQNGSTREPFEDIKCVELPGQNFIVLTGKNHLGTVKPPAPGTVTPGHANPETVSLQEFREQLQWLHQAIVEVRQILGEQADRQHAQGEDANERRYQDLARKLDALANQPQATFPTGCRATVLGIRVNCTLEFAQ